MRVPASNVVSRRALMPHPSLCLHGPSTALPANTALESVKLKGFAPRLPAANRATLLRQRCREDQVARRHEVEVSVKDSDFRPGDDRINQCSLSGEQRPEPTPNDAEVRAKVDRACLKLIRRRHCSHQEQ